jgi:hypothetical protein
MEHIIDIGELQVVAKRKRIAKQRKKKAKEAIKETKDKSKIDKMKANDLAELWDDLLLEITDVLEGKIDANEEISPMNVLLKVEDEQHQ